MKIKSDYSNEPQWKEVNVKSSLPKELACLDEIAHNLWYGWTHEARSLFTHLDEELYEKVGHNPVLLLEQLSYDRKEAIVKDKDLMKRVKNVYKMFKDYMNVKPNAKRPSVAYFCMEFGLNQVLKIYSGGLGMLAGDYLKEASDSRSLCSGLPLSLRLLPSESFNGRSADSKVRCANLQFTSYRTCARC